MADKGHVLDYLIERHKHVSALMEKYASPGNGAPGSVQEFQRELRGLEQSMAAILAQPN
jgi:hypothetical protein